MVVFLFVAIILVNFLVSLSRRRFSWIISIASVVFLVLMIAYSDDSFGDVGLYKMQYDNQTLVQDEELGYYYLCVFFYNLGFSFLQFRLALYFILLLATGMFLRPIVKSTNLLIVLFMLSFFYYSAVAIRFSIGFFLLIISISLLVRKKYIWSFLFALLAVLFHTLFLLGFLIAVVILPEKIVKKVRFILAIIIACELVVLVVSLVNTNIFISLSHLIAQFVSPIFGTRYMSYAVEGSYSRSRVIYVVAYFALFYFVYKTKTNGEDSQLRKTIIFCDLLFGIVAPLIVVEISLVRLLFISVFLNSIYLASTLNPSTLAFNKTIIAFGNKLMSKNMLVVCSTLLVFLWMFYYFNNEQAFDLYSFLQGNTLFS